MNRFSRVLLLFALAGLLVVSSQRIASADVTSVDVVDITGRIGTLVAGETGTRRMMLINVVTDSPETIAEISIWLEGANLSSLGAAMADGYERSVKSVCVYSSDSAGSIGTIAFATAAKYNNYYDEYEDNEFYKYSEIVWGKDSQIYLNLLPGNNYFVFVYEFDAPEFQTVGTTTSIAGERYWMRLDHITLESGASFSPNTMGSYVEITGNVIGTTFEFDTISVYAVQQTGIPVDPVAIACVKVTATGMNATWADFLFRAGGSGDDTRVASIKIYEDTTGDGVYSPESLGPPQDTLIETVDIPFFTNNGQVYHIFSNPITIADGTTRTFFFCYEFETTAPDEDDNGFNLSVVNVGGTFGILLPYDLTDLVSATLTLLPLPDGIDVGVGSEDPGSVYYYSVPSLTERYEIMQVKLTAHGIDAIIEQMKFVYTVTSTANPATIYSLELWLDANNSGAGSYDGTDMLLASLTNEQITSSINNIYTFNFTQSLKINNTSFANILLVAIFTDQAYAAYGFTMYEDGVSGSFDYVRFHPSAAPLYSGWHAFYTTPPVSSTPTPTPTLTTPTPQPSLTSDPYGNSTNPGADTGVGDNGSLIDGDTGGCFVATAAFGTLANDSVQILCAFRDTALYSSSVRGLVGTYYSVGPDLAEGLRSSAAIRAVLRTNINSLIGLVK